MAKFWQRPFAAAKNYLKILGKKSGWSIDSFGTGFAAPISSFSQVSYRDRWTLPMTKPFLRKKNHPMKTLTTIFMSAVLFLSCGESDSKDSKVQASGGKSTECPSCLGPGIDGGASIVTNEPRCWTSWVCTAYNAKKQCTNMVAKTVCGGGGGGGKMHQQ